MSDIPICVSSIIIRNALCGILMSCIIFFFFSSRRRHTRCLSDWSSDVCSSDLGDHEEEGPEKSLLGKLQLRLHEDEEENVVARLDVIGLLRRVREMNEEPPAEDEDRKSVV